MDREKYKWRVASLRVVGRALRLLHRSYTQRHWVDSRNYWEQNYASGGLSGPGSYGRLATAKADFLNRFVEDRHIATVLELGCGDGNQLSLANYPSYVGVDISPIAVDACRARFSDDPSKRFFVEGSEPIPVCELGLSLDVTFHLVEDETFERYMADLLEHSSRFVVLYTSDSDVYLPKERTPHHVRHRPVGRWMAMQDGWRLIRRHANPYPYKEGDIQNTSPADFYVYEKVTSDIAAGA
jgi:SAM-dependent methyltransferase